MRKIAAILLLLLLAFNWYGYRIVISQMQTRADRQLESRLDNSDYDESQLMEIRITMNMPYQQRFTEFERHYGEVEIDGRTYTYVKRKVEGDVVILKCIANQSKQQLKNFDSDLTKANNGIDTDHPGKQNQSSFAKNFWSEYDGDSKPVLRQFAEGSLSYSSAYNFYLPDTPVNTPHQPPEC